MFESLMVEESALAVAVYVATAIFKQGYMLGLKHGLLPSRFESARRFSAMLFALSLGLGLAVCGALEGDLIQRLLGGFVASSAAMISHQLLREAKEARRG